MTKEIEEEKRKQVAIERLEPFVYYQLNKKKGGWMDRWMVPFHFQVNYKYDGLANPPYLVRS